MQRATDVLATTHIFNQVGTRDFAGLMFDRQRSLGEKFGHFFVPDGIRTLVQQIQERH